MKVLVIGNGAREHAIAWKLLLSSQVKEVFVAPGNGGTRLMARNLDVPVNDVKALADAALLNGVSLAIVGPEAPLGAGIVDHFTSLGIPTFGPTAAAAAIECSKVFAKDLMQKYGIPCARSRAFDSLAEARAYVRTHPLPVVIKADGLAAGKGVTVAATREEAERALEEAMQTRVFGAAGDRVLVEECLAGPEVSVLAFTDGVTVRPMVPACDYKRVRDADQGPNTGGMGSYSPPGFFDQRLAEQVQSTILEPTVRALAAEGRPYKGVLYAGLMLTAEGPKVLEFNCRFGDPETQVVLPRLKADLVDVALAVVEGNLSRVSIEWSEEPCVGVVLASEGYPGKYRTGLPITGLDSLDDDVLVFHAGTRWGSRPAAAAPRRSLLLKRLPQPQAEELQTAGGRVLTVVARGRSMAEARRRVYANVARIRFEGCHYRTDIALREVEEEIAPEELLKRLTRSKGAWLR